MQDFCRSRESGCHQGCETLRRTCVHCGLCAAVCPTEAITLHDSGHGRMLPVIASERCVDCGLCEDICPTIRRPRTSCSEGVPLRGVRRLVLGHAGESDVRFRAASGGVVTALALYWVGSHPAHRALVVVPSRSGPYNLFPEAVITSEPATIREAAGSHYVGVPTLRILRSVPVDELPNLMVVGLPCQVRALRLWSAATGNALGPLIGLFCSGAKDQRFLFWLLSCMRLHPSQVRRFSIRSCGFPGKSVAELHDGSRRALPKDTRRRSLAWRDATFAYRGCLLCPDSTSECADIACGDPWTLPDAADDGLTLACLRTDSGVKLWREAVQSKRVAVLREVKPDEMESRSAVDVLRAKRAAVLRSYVLREPMSDATALLDRVRALRHYLRWMTTSSRLVSSLTARAPTGLLRFIRNRRLPI